MKCDNKYYSPKIYIVGNLLEEGLVEDYFLQCLMWWTISFQDLRLPCSHVTGP